MGIVIGDKAYHRQGVASLVIPQCIKKIAKERSIRRVYIETYEMNKPAIGLFEKLGFQSCKGYDDEGYTVIIKEFLIN